MTEKPVAIVLGGTKPHVSLVNKLKARGYYVLLVDYTMNPPANEVADEHVRISTLDNEAVLRLARDRNASVVISTSIDQSNATCCYVAEKLSLPHPYSYQTALNVTDKGLMKKIFIDNCIPTSKYIVVDSERSDSLSKVTFPSVVKPVDCNSSKGVVRVDNRDELEKAVISALCLSRSHHAIVEDYNDGEEIQVDCIAYKGSADIILTRKKRHIEGVDGMVLQSIGSIIPAPLDEILLSQAKKIANQIVSAFGIENTPFFYQAIVTDDGIKVLEFAPRSGGGLSSYLLQHCVDYDVIEAGICSYLDIPIPHKPKELRSVYLTTLLYMNAGVFDKVIGLETLMKEEIILDSFQYKKRGSVVDGDMRSSNRIASFVISGENEEEVYQRYQSAMKRIDIVSPEGVSLLRKELY